MGALLILSMKWAEFLTYDEDLPARELMIFKKKSGSMGDMLNLGYWQ